MQGIIDYTGTEARQNFLGMCDTQKVVFPYCKMKYLLVVCPTPRVERSIAYK